MPRPRAARLARTLTFTLTLTPTLTLTLTPTLTLTLTPTLTLTLTPTLTLTLTPTLTPTRFGPAMAVSLKARLSQVEEQVRLGRATLGLGTYTGHPRVRYL